MRVDTGKPICFYDLECTRKNPLHFERTADVHRHRAVQETASHAVLRIPASETRQSGERESRKSKGRERESREREAQGARGRRWREGDEGSAEEAEGCLGSSCAYAVWLTLGQVGKEEGEDTEPKSLDKETIKAMMKEAMADVLKVRVSCVSSTCAYFCHKEAEERVRKEVEAKVRQEYEEKLKATEQARAKVHTILALRFRDRGLTRQPEMTALPPCQYGDKCARKNPQHFKEYSHPPSLKAAK